MYQLETRQGHHRLISTRFASSKSIKLGTTLVLIVTKHFESIHYLNNHHRKQHPPVTCDVCGKLYDTPNSLIRHSYRHLDRQHKCKDCEQSFHFKSELTSHSMKHAMERLHCKQCDRNFYSTFRLKRAHRYSWGKMEVYLSWMQ